MNVDFRAETNQYNQANKNIQIYVKEFAEIRFYCLALLYPVIGEAGDCETCDKDQETSKHSNRVFEQWRSKNSNLQDKKAGIPDLPRHFRKKCCSEFN